MSLLYQATEKVLRAASNKLAFVRRRRRVTCRFSTGFNGENHRRIIDFRSDTVTSPSRAMIETALNATTGDDVMGEDPTTLELQEYVADMFGKEKALFVPTGTMSNLVAIMAHCHGRASEIIIGSRSHSSLWEGGNAAGLAGVYSRQIQENVRTAEFDPQLIRGAARSDNDDHYCKTELLCLENTHNELGGVALSPQYIDRMGDLSKELGIRLHIDGARIWNAAIAQQISLKEYCKNVDSISVCLSKGLGAPLGSVLVGETEFIRLAKRARKRCGGGMRQVGVVASMGLYALQNNFHRLVDDHNNAKRFANILRTDGGFRVQSNYNGQVDTNIFYFSLPESSVVLSDEFQRKLKSEYGIKVSGGYGTNGDIFRIVTHLDIHDEDIGKASEAMIEICSRSS